MWMKADEMPKADVDAILERYDQTAPEIQRLTALQGILDTMRLTKELAELQAMYDRLYDDSRGERPQ